MITSIFPGNEFQTQYKETIEIYKLEDEYFLKQEETNETLKVVDFWVHYSDESSEFKTLPLKAMIEFLNILECIPMF